MILLIIIIILAVVALWFILRQKKLTKNTVLCFTGGLGSGKTFMAVRSAIKYYKMQNFLYALSRIPLLGSLLLGKRFKCNIYSNIPILLKRRRKSKGNLYSYVLKKEHITLQERLPENACVVMDEIGQFASQYEHDNPYIMEYLQEFVRFYRHYINGRLIITDQCSANIVVPIRRRIATIYNVSNFHRALLILPFYVIEVQDLTVTEESIQNTNVLDIDTKKEYFFGFLPWRWLSRLLKLGRYDSRCYSIMYMSEKSHIAPEKWDKLKTNYLIDIVATGTEKQAYKKFRKMPD